ncbi:MAG: hypothetical protein HUJ11_02015, partial [Arenibacter algicola]|nr:hypothetical protein [Arenibacter algicola]
MMLSKFTLDDVCESLAAIPANIAVFKVEPDDQFVIMKMSPMLEALYGVERDSAIGTAVDEFDFDEALRRRLKSTYTKCRDSCLPLTTE